MVYELERVCNGFSCSMSVTYTENKISSFDLKYIRTRCLFCYQPSLPGLVPVNFSLKSMVEERTIDTIISQTTLTPYNKI